MINSYEDFVEKYQDELEGEIGEKELTRYILMVERKINNMYGIEFTEKFYSMLLEWYMENIDRLNYSNVYLQKVDKQYETTTSILEEGYYLYLKEFVPKWIKRYYEIERDQKRREK